MLAFAAANKAMHVVGMVLSISMPMVVSGSSGLPGCQCCASAFSRAGTRQRCSPRAADGSRRCTPVLVVEDAAGGGANRLLQIRAIGEDMALLPPASSHTRFIAVAGVFQRLPVRVEPVKVMTSTSGCRASACPASWPKPLTTFNTPSGRPASFASQPDAGGERRFSEV